jgi:hypothetical protein
VLLAGLVGSGLAAQQVGRALQLTVIDVREATDRPSTLELNGAPADPASIMPLVLINPEWKAVNDPVAGPGRVDEALEVPAHQHRQEDRDHGFLESLHPVKAAAERRTAAAICIHAPSPSPDVTSKFAIRWEKMERRKWSGRLPTV